MANEKMFLAGSEPDNYWHKRFGGDDGFCFVGDEFGGGQDGAIRFPGVTGSGNCNEAQLYFRVGFASSNSGQMDLNIRGIDEDNTGLFTGDPFGRSTTDALIQWILSRPSVGSFANINVTSIVNEIRNRGGWSSGNAIGFLIYESGNTGTDIYFSGGIESSSASSISYLMIRESANPNLTPTAKSVSAPTFPLPDSFGIKISEPGVSVLTATEDQLFFTTRKLTNKIALEGSITTTANTTYNIPHGLGYRPVAIAYAKETGSSKRYKVPRYIPESVFQDQFPSLDSTNGTIQTDSTNLKITTTSACEIYYRIFLEEN